MSLVRLPVGHPKNSEKNRKNDLLNGMVVVETIPQG